MTDSAAPIAAFLRRVYAAHPAVIGVSGGIDSALSLTLLVHALGATRVQPVFLPYKTQSTEDGKLAARFNGIPEDRWLTVDIAPMADAACAALGIAQEDRMRRGNVMARMRMVTLFDVAKRTNALVCGTENKSEKHLGYFTRFGDAASDVEPIHHLTKTQVRSLAQELGLPGKLLENPPTAGLWDGQTDEAELGFTYADADAVIGAAVDRGLAEDAVIADTGLPAATVRAVLQRIASQKFKHETPYAFGAEH